MADIAVIGGGLAGPEAAWQAARHGLEVELWEMRPRVSTPAHQTGGLGELVCSNSLKSEATDSAPWLLKQELRRGGSLLLACAASCAVPGGQALTVDRVKFSAAIEAALLREPRIHLRRQEATALPPSDAAQTILATGPLTSPPLAAALASLAGRKHLSFYDAISPIVDAESLDYDRMYPGSRWDRGGDDFWNCPFDRAQYERFYTALLTAESYPLHQFEDVHYFEACLPLEELARRGEATLRFGPMKPVGLRDPRSGRIPFAAVQLRRENLRADSFNLVGFQNHLRFGAQAEVLRLIPGLERARFLRYGQVHRNSYLAAPAVLNERLQFRSAGQIWSAGQLCGTEGYIEAIATGWLAGQFAAAAVRGEEPAPPPRATALGSLLHYITHASAATYAPANITFDLLPPLDAPERDRGRRRQLQCRRALMALESWLPQVCTPAPVNA
ncbi:MAG: methylenetetrahydrofolate--tRNA-(uracil(54)-C(5))-methyltransferase (FADH(2)-oxidizing) TrmFO [Terriglobales bacterium]